jgi:hypothetical protein
MSITQLTMKSLYFFFAIALSFCSAMAAELSEQDAGTFVILDQKGAPTDTAYRLSVNNGKWTAEGKKSGSTWTNISCDTGCEYRATSESEIQSYFPSDWRANSKISCIQNMAQAFCRYTATQDPTKGGHLIISLVSGRPIPVFVRRVPS